MLSRRVDELSSEVGDVIAFSSSFFISLSLFFCLARPPQENLKKRLCIYYLYVCFSTINKESTMTKRIQKKTSERSRLNEKLTFFQNINKH
jgi:hypothetical protein